MPRYSVVLYNDDVHTVTYVSDVLCVTFRDMSMREAAQHVYVVHTRGSSKVRSFVREHAEAHCELLRSHDLVAHVHPENIA